MTASHTRPSRAAFLSTVPCPVIVIARADDIAPRPDTGAAQADAAPHGRLHVVSDCSHHVPLEQPACLNGILRKVIADEVW